MAEIYSIVGIGIFLLITLLVGMGLAQEGYEDDDGFKPGQPPDGRDPQQQTVTSAIDREGNFLPRPGPGK